MAFLDDDDALDSDDVGPSRRYGAPRQRPFVARRLMAIVVGVLVIVLIVLGIRGCLNARKERGFENYVSDLASITTETQQLSAEFFKRLQDPGDLTELSLKAEVSADRGTAENLLERVQNLDTPGELAAAQEELNLAYELRRDGIAGVADQIDTALANEGAKDATEKIATFMGYFQASDVLYERSRSDIETELNDQDIVPDENLPKAPKANFLPSPIEEWLDPTSLATLLSGVTASGGGGSCEGVCGLALLESSIGGTALTADASTSVGGGGPYELEVQVQNQGDQEATDVTVEYAISGADSGEGSGTITRIKAGATQSAKLNITPDPPSGEELTLEVTAVPVPGEEIADNNTATYTVVFE